MPFTARPGSVLTQPANVVPGGGTFNSVRTVNLVGAQLTFSGNVSSGLLGRLLYAVVATVISQIRLKGKSQSRPAIIVQSRFIPFKVVQRTTTQLDSVPKTFDIAVTETFPYTVDVSNYLTGSDTISSISAVLTYLSTGQTVTSLWQGSISTAANLIQVPINGPALQLGQVYQLAVTFTASTGKRLTVLSQFSVVA